MSGQIKISSITIAKNEEKNIGRCIKSLSGCIDEIIVIIDSKSTDKTLDIVKNKNVKYEVVEWMGYSKTKQYAAELATNDWILWIDSDEALTPALREEINLFKGSEPAYKAYSIPRIANFLGKWIKHSGWYPGRVVRFFDKRFAEFNDNHIHEELVVEGESGKLVNDIEHYTDPNIYHYFQKFNNYTTLAADELYTEGKKFKLTDVLIRPWFIFIKMYFIKLGFLDGIQGFILAVFSSAYVFTKYAKLWEQKNKS